eukprot:SAG11_NODE_31009_length_295_cov_1.581633_1_plen_40_part_01
MYYDLNLVLQLQLRLLGTTVQWVINLVGEFVGRQKNLAAI